MSEAASQNATKPAAHIEALTSVRFLAAFSVLLAHFDLSLKDKLPGMGYDFIHRGGTAVMFFFVLSGFIMTHVYQSRDLSSSSARKKYFIARFARIAPLYYIALGLGILNILMGANKGSFPAAVWIGSIASKFTFTQALFPRLVAKPIWAMVTWTLSVEFCFYLLFPFVLGWFLRLSPRLLAGLAVAAVFYSAVVPQIAQNVTDSTMGQTVWYLNASMYPGFFLMGMIVRRAQERYSEFTGSSWFGLLGIGIVMIAMVRVFDIPLWAMNSGHLVGSSLVLLGLFNAKGAVAGAFRLPAFVLLGEASYALYLLHGPVGSVLEKLKIQPKENFVHFLIFTVAAVVVSIASFKLIEIPARNWITSRANSKESASTN